MKFIGGLVGYWLILVYGSATVYIILNKFGIRDTVWIYVAQIVIAYFIWWKVMRNKDYYRNL